jgi:hypothetical protein
VLGPSTRKVTGKRKEVYSEGLHTLQLRVKTMRLIGYIARKREMTNSYNILVGKSKGKILIKVIGAD